MTARQYQVFEWIRTFVEHNQYPPSVREIGQRLGITSPNGVKCHLNALKEKGYLTWRPGFARTLRVTAIPFLNLDKPIPRLQF